MRESTRVAVIGNYLPRQCGIATFTTDLVEGLSAEAPDIYNWAAAMNDRLEGYAYPEKVLFKINQNKLSDYSIASQFLNISQTDIVCVQHEYVVFGGAVQVLFTILMSFVISMQFGLSFDQFVFIGFLVSLSSTAIVLKLIPPQLTFHDFHPIKSRL